MIPDSRASNGRRATRAAIIVGLLLAGCSGPPETGEAQQRERLRFVDVGAEAGLSGVVHAGREGKDHLLDSAGTGAAWLDYDRDGWIDAYVVNGWKVDGSTVVHGTHALYRNLGDGTFEEVSERAGVGGDGHWGSGVAVADFDDDGWPDILVTHFGPTALYRNLGDGTFENVAAEVGIEAPGWNTGAAFFDADSDGDLDLYIAAYIDCSLADVLDARRTLSWKGVDQVAVGPFGLTGASDHFYRAEGGRFVEATSSAGLEDLARGYGFAVRAGDLDGDQRPDLYVANDSDANYYYRNDGEGHFREIGMWTGLAFDAGGAAQAGMGVAVGDADGDGVRDIFVTNFAEDYSTLYHGEPGGFFEDVSDATGVGPATYLSLSWGTVFADLDHDGDEDLVVANGHIYPQVDAHPEYGMTYRQRDQLLENDGTGHFRDATTEGGPGFLQERSSRGLAAGDYDNDGDLDLLITHLDAPPSLLRNDSVAGGSWLTVVPEVPPGRGTAIGTTVVVEAGGRRFVRDVASSGSFLSVHDPRPNFGLGDVSSVDRVEVRWADGTRTVLENVEVDQTLTVAPD